MRDGAVGEAHVVAPARALRRVDARRPVLARQNHACARERRTQHVEHARRLVSQRIEPPLPLFAPHEPQVGKESVHGILRAGGCGSVRRSRERPCLRPQERPCLRCQKRPCPHSRERSTLPCRKCGRPHLRMHLRLRPRKRPRAFARRSGPPGPRRRPPRTPHCGTAPLPPARSKSCTARCPLPGWSAPRARRPRTPRPRRRRARLRTRLAPRARLRTLPAGHAPPPRLPQAQPRRRL